MSKIPNVLRAFTQMPWAMLPEKLAEIRGVLSGISAGATEEERLRAFRAQYPAANGRDSQRVRVGSVEIIPIQGVIAQKMNLMMEYSGGTSTEMLTQQIQRAVEDETITSILLDVDSPGGGVFGVAELADYIRSARDSKKIVAVANSMAASAAYWIASAASELVVTPSGMVGSIGVYRAHDDLTEAQKMMGVKTTIVKAGKFKAEGNPFEPLSEEAMAEMQAQVDSYYEMFVRAVAAGRKETLTKVRDGYGQGRMLLAADAKAAGMVDRVATLDTTLGRMLVRNGRPAGAKAAISTVRDLESFLRDEGGLSHTEAKRIASGAFKDEQPPRDGVAEPEPDVKDQERREALRAFIDGMKG